MTDNHQPGDNPPQNVTFPSNGSQAHGYLARPPGGSGPGVIVIQEWWGLTSHIASVADRLAARGFVALAPDLYGGRTTHDEDEAGQLMQALPVDRAARDLAGAVEFLLADEAVIGDAVGTIGFCMGGAFVLALAANTGSQVAAAVAFYPVGPVPDDLSSLTAPVQAHFGSDDTFVPEAQARQLVAKLESETDNLPDARFYPAGHAFFNDDNLLGTYDEAQADIAWERTVTFLHERLG
ncbi:MAG: dienelactone hydrolase family protein [Actinomycetota bacterium]|nr:dienelactone hydrolase family protein [Actinomycetota bacterium]